MTAKITNQNRLDKVIEALQRVPDDTNKMMFEMAQSLSESEIIQSFNQAANDLFTVLVDISTKSGREGECKMGANKYLFTNALKINARLPLEKFTLVILEYAPEIYAEKEDYFLSMAIPDGNVNVGNEFGIIRSAVFKEIWVTLSKRDKNNITEKFMILTTYAHVFLYKTVLGNA